MKLEVKAAKYWSVNGHLELQGLIYSASVIEQGKLAINDWSQMLSWYRSLALLEVQRDM